MSSLTKSETKIEIPRRCRDSVFSVGTKRLSVGSNAPLQSRAAFHGGAQPKPRNTAMAPTISGDDAEIP